jgi:putative restriction endonuclease
MSIEKTVEKFYNLKRNKIGSHESPHKPLLLLSIIDLIEVDNIKDNKITLSDTLINIFKSYFSIVSKEIDKPTINNPFYHLTSDGFWNLIPKEGRPPVYIQGRAGKAPSVKILREEIQFAELDVSVWLILQDPHQRTLIRDALYSRYFSDYSNKMATLSEQHLARISGFKPKHNSSNIDDLKLVRDQAFRKTVNNIYDYRCSACGVRFKLDNLVMVDAAHLVPFSDSKNDHPSNGISLCKNHHWAMDRFILAPTRDRTWKVSVRLDRRIPDFKEMIELDGKPMFLPKEEMFLPCDESLCWRENHLI